MEQPILSVTQLNQQAKSLLETNFPRVLIEGEISNFVQPASGHWYFSLKDDTAQVRCAMFRFKNNRVRFNVKNGTHVIAKAKVSLYQGRGDFQLLIEDLEDAGTGALQRAFNELKLKLEKEGLFADAHKRSLPYLPQQIGIITSATGAAIRDIIKVLHRRCPMVPIVIYPTLVQGEQAAEQIVNAINTANARNECDVLVLARGGGSLEDLWPFNEEAVARAIFASALPIISGIGHQIDYTIADFVADVRTATPSAAAERVTPTSEEMLLQLQLGFQRLSQACLRQYEHLSQSLDWLNKRLIQTHPLKQLKQLSEKYQQLHQRLIRAITLHLTKTQERFRYLTQALQLVSPLATLGRGYAIVQREDDKTLVTTKDNIKIGDNIEVRLQDGVLRCLVENQQG
jgi:exodeoxyribonuclease VII large subunit